MKMREEQEKVQQGRRGIVSSDEKVAIIIHVAGGSACDLTANVDSDIPCFTNSFGNLIDSFKREQVRMGQHMRNPR